MIDQLATAAAWLRGVRKACMSVTVRYRRGDDSVQVSATRGQMVFRLSDDVGGTVRVVRRDYLIETADLVLAGALTLPQAGDRIEEAAGSDTFIYEVMGPGGGEPEWRYSDPYRGTLRIHTKHIDTE